MGSVMKTFEEVFLTSPDVHAEAPGRVNLLGEHTDYNDGYVLPTAIPQKTFVAIKHNDAGEYRIYAAAMDKLETFTLQQPPDEHFASYVYGCICELKKRQIDIPPLDIYVHSSVPMGVGLSSSAALEVAALRALRKLLHLDIDDVTIAQIGQQAEIKYAHVNVGIMDQMASSLADTNHLLFLDTRTLERKLLPLPAGSEILVVDSGIPRTLAGSKYNERRAECEEAARLLKVAALRDVTDPAAIASLPEPYRRRAKHVITENNRVLQALQGLAAEVFGRLMNASHQSLRDDYEVSIPPLDDLVRLLQDQPEVFGARLTGAGFGGACVALCKQGRARFIAEKVLAQYQELGHKGQVLVP